METDILLELILRFSRISCDQERRKGNYPLMGTSLCSLITERISTRRFNARPALVLLLPKGCSELCPLARIRLAGISFFTRYCLTASARATDNFKISFAEPLVSVNPIISNTASGWLVANSTTPFNWPFFSAWQSQYQSSCLQYAPACLPSIFYTIRKRQQTPGEE